MAMKLANNATSTLAASIASDATTLTVASIDAEKYPTLVDGDWFPLTIVDGTGNLEVVRVTARAGAVLTITRAQEGTTAKAFNAGSRVDMRMTAAVFAQFPQLGSDNKMLPSQLPNIGAQMAAAEAAETPEDGDRFVGVRSGGSTLFRTTWAGIKAAIGLLIATATGGNMAGRAFPRKVGGTDINFNWSGQAGQPSWLWGGTDGINMFVYNPSNFNVNAVGGWTQPIISGQIEARAAAYADDRRNQCVTAMRMAGEIGFSRNGVSPKQQSSGYVLTGVQGTSSGGDGFYYARQPQAFIPNIGWFAPLTF